MKFGRLAVAGGEGAILAHAVRLPGLSFKKGEVLGAAQIAMLTAAGVETVIAATLEPGDVHEDEAARQLAAALAGPHVRLERAFTGRCNLVAQVAGLVVVDADAVDAINAVDEAITVATLLPFRPVAAGEMIATVKIIPFSVPDSALSRALRVSGVGSIAMAPFRPLNVGVVSTLLPGLKPSVIVKTLRVLDARLASAGARIATDVRVRHDAAALIEAVKEASRGVDLLIVFGASAITDRRDVIPSAIVGAGGTVMHLGMPVDPGNLLLLGALPSLGRAIPGRAIPGGAIPDGAIPVIGAPGCARSPKENGFDFVLHRLLAGLPITGADLRAMGVGGLLSEIATRPQPRNPGDV